MARFALALAAIVILTLSAGLTRGQPQAVPLSAGITTAAAFKNSTDTFRAELMLIKQPAPPHSGQQSMPAEPPAPALLVYLALILVGSAGSVLLARRRLHGAA